MDPASTFSRSVFLQSREQKTSCHCCRNVAAAAAAACRCAVMLLLLLCTVLSDASVINQLVRGGGGGGRGNCHREREEREGRERERERERRKETTKRRERERFATHRHNVQHRRGHNKVLHQLCL